MARIIAMGKESGAKVVFVQPQFSEKSAAVILEQIGAEVVRLDPLAHEGGTATRRPPDFCGRIEIGFWAG